MASDPGMMTHRLAALRAFNRWPVSEVDRFGRALDAKEDWALFRINPVCFAEREGFDEQVALDLFVHGVKVGLFDLVWTCLCVFCGAVEYAFDTIDRIPTRDFHCTRCDADIRAWLDERVEVCFSIHPSVATLAIDPFRDWACYQRYYTSSNLLRPPVEAASHRIHAHLLLEAEASGELEFDLAAGDSLRLVSYDRHAQALLSSEAGAPASLDVDLLPTGFATTAACAPGRVVLRVNNRASTPTGVVVLDGDVARFRHSVETQPAALRPFVSGQKLLCTESFRRLFRVQSLDEELALNVRHVALLFTDLVASTALYEVVGDVAAYARVRAHFRELHAATEICGGAVVKTMGDAIMAAFDSTLAAARAGVDILRRIEALNATMPPGGTPLAVRIGVHAGPAIIVHAQGRLDYFGQVANIAARVQSLAGAASMCLSLDALRMPGVEAALAETSTIEGPQRVVIRGLSEPIDVYRIELATHARA